MQASRLLAFAVAATACAHPLRMTSIVPSPGCRNSGDGAVAWVGPADERDRRPLDEWCATVGSPAVRLQPAAVAATDEIAIVSWNIHVGGGDVAALQAALVRGDLTSGHPVSQYVLLLQEAVRTGDAVPASVPAAAPVPRAIRPARTHDPRSIVAIAQRLGLAWAYVPSMRNGRNGSGGIPEDRGNAILSTLPLTQVVAVELPFEHQRRVAVAGVVSGTSSDGAQWELAVASIQLDTGLAWTRGGPLAARTRAAQALVGALDRFAGKRMIAAGDFNAWLGEAEPAVRLLAVAFPDTPRFGDAATWVSGVGIGAPLDYIFARSGGRTLTVRRAASRFGSDHYPLVAELEVRDGAVTARP